MYSNKKTSYHANCLPNKSHRLCFESRNEITSGICMLLLKTAVTAGISVFCSNLSEAAHTYLPKDWFTLHCESAANCDGQLNFCREIGNFQSHAVLQSSANLQRPVWMSLKEVDLKLTTLNLLKRTYNCHLSPDRPDLAKNCHFGEIF